ncbi:hypothetical protein NITLEN_10005 [Nitrospira lenta]|uniref:Uncharacterized protein n=1 Tax=Nitrospira lenta TaxID=1436998 RepID=A0A330L0X8_9BACT|nr:hypothetical protein NITLEN_10005 [Nitrospira lenta]
MLGNRIRVIDGIHTDSFAWGAV